jgi:putative hydrolase of the HAD superfamily
MLHAVLFDLDNTLIDRKRAFRECVHSSFTDPQARAELLQLDGGGHGQREPLLRAWERHAGWPMTQQKLGAWIAARLRPDRELLEALRILATTVKLGIITNGGSETQRGKIRAAGLDEMFSHECIWVSAEVGKAKPDPEIFLLASQNLDVTPEHCLFVGDHLEHDIAGALGAGLRARHTDAPLNGERLSALLDEERTR